jgi:hypothetical protein
MSDSERSISLDAQKFGQLIQCLAIIKDLCNDVDLRDGFIRQRSNDRAVIFEMDLTPLISDVSIPITNLKQKFDLFKMYSDEAVTFTITDSKFSIADNFSGLNFEKPSLEYMDNKFLSTEELNSIFELFDEDLVMKIDISKTISDRLRIIAQSFNINSVQVGFSGETANISATTQAKDQHAKLVDNITLNSPIERAVTNLIITPFVTEHDSNIEFSLFNDQENQLINKSVMSIGDVTINIYGRSSIVRSE